MLKPSSTASKKVLLEAAEAFQGALPGSPGEEYLTGRGIGEKTAGRLRLGYVSPDAPPEGWERYAGRLAIPYVNAKSEVVWIKFRSTPETKPDFKGEVDKYAQEPGGQTRLYNTQALSATGDTLALCEGEFDVITLTALGIPAVGIPGASSWKTWFNRCLQGWGRIVLFYDDDKAGRELVKTVKGKIPDVVPVAAPGGHNDVNEAYMAGLGDRIVALAKGEDEDHEPERAGQEEGGDERSAVVSQQAEADYLRPDVGAIPY